MSNSFSNRVSAGLIAADITAIKAAIATIKTKLPFLVGLTTAERQSIPKMNQMNRLFATDAVNAVANNADMLPAYFTAGELRKDLDLYVALDEIALVLAQLSEQVSDTQMLAGSEAYISALSAYRLFGSAATAGVPGADAVADMLAARFAGQGGPGEGTVPTDGTKPEDTPGK
jgi:hypothetical protein